MFTAGIEIFFGFLAGMLILTLVGVFFSCSYYMLKALWEKIPHR